MLGRDFVILRSGRHNNDWGAACKLNDVRIADPIWRGDDDLITLVDGRNKRIEQGMLAARVHGDLLRRIIDIVVTLELGDDRLLQRRDAVDRGILGHPVTDGLNGSVLDKVRRVKIRLPGRQTYHINALRFQINHASRHG